MSQVKKVFRSKSVVYISVLLVALLLGSVTWYKNWQSKFDAPRKNTPNIQFMISKNKTLDAVIGDLKYYDFIKDEGAFTFALEHTQDNKHEGENFIKVGKGSKTIDREAVYTINQSMNAWQLASVLLNGGTHQDCDHGCPDSAFDPELVPGGDFAPTLKEKYSWVKTYDDCIKAIGHDGGQVTSEQAFQRTGHRICNTADGRYFVQGKEGYTDYPPYP